MSGGDTLDVRVTANDSSGIVYAGYRLLRVRATDSVLVRAESTFVPAGTSASAPSRRRCTTGSFRTRCSRATTPSSASPSIARACTRRPASRARPSPSSTARSPVLTFLGPIAGAKLNVGDSLLVTAHLTDNIALQKVSFVGISTRTPTRGHRPDHHALSAGHGAQHGDLPRRSPRHAHPALPPRARRRSTPSPTRSSSPAS